MIDVIDFPQVSCDKKDMGQPCIVSELFLFPCGNLNLLLVLVTDSHANFP